MQKTILIIATFLLILGCMNYGTAQINRTLKTTIADILAQMPTEDIAHSNKLSEEIIGLKTEGILQLCNMLVPAGTGDDTQVRYAVESLTIYAGRPDNKGDAALVEGAMLKALSANKDEEIKFFLIERLLYCASNKSVVPLSKYLHNDELSDVTLITLTAIGSQEAAKAIFEATAKTDAERQTTFIESLGRLRYQPAISMLKKEAKSGTGAVQEKALMALAEIGTPDVKTTITKAVKKANYQNEPSRAVLAYLHYANRLAESGNKALSSKICYDILKKCTASEQLIYRSASVHLLRDLEGGSFTEQLIKEAQHEDDLYRGAVLAAASKGLNSKEVTQWVEFYPTASPAAKMQLIPMLQEQDEAVVFEQVIKKAIKSDHEGVKLVGTGALTYQDKSKVLPLTIELLKSSESSEITQAVKNVLLQTADVKDGAFLAENFLKVTGEGRAVLIDVLAARKAYAQFDAVAKQISSNQKEIVTAAYAALPSLATAKDLPDLLQLLNKAEKDSYIKNIQQAITNTLQGDSQNLSEMIFKAFNKSKSPEKLMPVLPYLGNEQSLELLTEAISSDDEKQKMIALEALSKWQGNEAIPYLFEKTAPLETASIRNKAFNYYLSQVTASSYPDDQKLLLIKKLMPRCKTVEEQKLILRQAQKIKTFLSLVYVSNYLQDGNLSSTAGLAAIRIALPTPGGNDGLSGDVVRKILTNSMEKLNYPGSEYDKIDVREYLGKMPADKGFVSMYNGKDLSGWQGLVENPIARSKMTPEELKEKQKEADEQMRKEWIIDNGDILFVGEGYKNLCSIKKYADFEMLVDWKIGNKGDSGIYLRGTPQVQIWDTSRVEVGAQVGSGGLYNNQKNRSTPLLVADNPINDWNTFRIKMVGERVTVHLNGELVVDNITLENYWDRNLPIFPKEAIELQAHGENVRFRNIYVREIPSGDFLLDETERQEGFKSLFNGKDLDQWIGNKQDYVVENNEIVVRPEQGGHGNLFTAEEYSDFIFRFEFKLTPGGNNGLGIHAPLEGDAAFVGKELQILDNTAAVYANLEPYQYHGSVYGIIPAKRGYLNPVGEWNYEEVIVKGDDIKITLNGTVIVEGNMKEASKNGTMDGQDHPGLQRNKGHIGFLGHGSVLWFRNIRIKTLND